MIPEKGSIVITMEKNTAYYLSKGFDEKTAAYFAGGRKQIIDVRANADYTLIIGFDNGEKRVYDMRPLLKRGTVFETLTDPENFKRVYVDDTHSIAWDIDPDIDSKLVWNNKIDLCSDSCYMDSIPLENSHSIP